MRSGFSIVKNGDRLGYPYLESLRSLAPLVDEIVVAHGDSSDSTLSSLQKLQSELTCPLRILDSPWDPGQQRGGFELARQTNLALKACVHDVCLYLQADEVFMETQNEMAREDLARFEKDSDVSALAFRWQHFFGNYQTVVESRSWYRREIRAVKRSTGLQSFGDAQGFRIAPDWSKPRAALSRASVLHYGWVRPPQLMATKSEELDRLWHGSARDGSHHAETVYPIQYGLKTFRGIHPAVMAKRIAEQKDFDPFRNQQLKKNARYWKLWLTAKLEALTDWRPGEFKNYKNLKKY